MRLIDVDDFIERLAVAPMIQEAMRKAFNHMPTVELVMCKDCKYCSVDMLVDGNVPYYVCIEMDCGVDADGFCSWGERKDEID